MRYGLLLLGAAITSVLVLGSGASASPGVTTLLSVYSAGARREPLVRPQNREVMV
jgi:hypothetical protein